MEYVLTRGKNQLEQYIAECAELGFDIVEISAGFVTIPVDDWIGLIKKVQQAGLKAKPEVGIQFGAGGASDPATLERQGISPPTKPVIQLDAARWPGEHSF